MMNNRIFILSPHFDDAAFSCGDHIRAWRRQGYAITVLIVFTRFRTRSIPKYSMEYVRASGCLTVESFEKIRRQEEKLAISLLDVTEKHFAYVDAGFRGGTTPIYPRRADLFSGTISSKDSPLLLKLTRDFTLLPPVDRVIVPLGIGKHIDHVLVRRAAELSWPTQMQSYYVDFPYALQVKNWTRELLWKLLSMGKSIRWITPAKRRVIDCYASQTSLLFSKNPVYPEILLSPRRKE